MLSQALLCLPCHPLTESPVSLSARMGKLWRPADMIQPGSFGMFQQVKRYSQHMVMPATWLIFHLTLVERASLQQAKTELQKFGMPPPDANCSPWQVMPARS